VSDTKTIRKQKKELTTFEKIISIQNRHIDMFLSTFWELSVYTGIPERTFHNHPELVPPRHYYGGNRWRIRDVIEHLNKYYEEHKKA